MGLFNFASPTSFRLASDAGGSVSMASDVTGNMALLMTKPHDSHPSLGHLTLLVLEAVMEVVCVSLPGYVLARLGHFDAEKQRFLANLNVTLFTPCLIFSKLASQLNADKLSDLGIIPVIFVVQTFVSWLVAKVVTKAFRFNKRASNFVTAMGVFANSNSLPISLVISLSQTLKGLHWDKIKGDNDEEVAARGILYLLIFQQLGQLVRWSWGYHVLLAPKEAYAPEDGGPDIEEGRYRDDDSDFDRRSVVEGVLIPGLDGALVSAASMDERRLFGRGLDGPESSNGNTQPGGSSPRSFSDDSDRFEPAGRTPVEWTSRTTPYDSDDDDNARPAVTLVNGTISEASTIRKRGTDTPQIKCISSNSDGTVNGHRVSAAVNESDILSFPRINSLGEMVGHGQRPAGLRGAAARVSGSLRDAWAAISQGTVAVLAAAWAVLPSPVKGVLTWCGHVTQRTASFVWDFMNPPLWAMLAAVVVASVPDLQRLFFEEGSLIRNSVTNGIRSSGGVAVPLILVVLGANLARSTSGPKKSGDDSDELAVPFDPEEERIGSRLLVASLVCRMVFPTLLMAPFLAFLAKYAPVSILDDPIFVIVCFLLTGAPSALQLAQICQINGVFEGIMSKILFQSYVVWILPSTLVLVMCALEVVEWAKPV